MKTTATIISISFMLLLCFTNCNTLVEGTTPTGLTLENVGEIDTDSVPMDLQIVDDMMYVVEQQGLLIFDISDPENPVLIGEDQDTGTAHGIHVIGDYAFVADLDDGLEIFNISDFNDIQKIDTYYSGQSATEVLVQDSLCFVSVDASKFFVLNSSNIFLQAPLNTPVKRVDAVKAAREVDVTFDMGSKNQ